MATFGQNAEVIFDLKAIELRQFFEKLGLL